MRIHGAGCALIDSIYMNCSYSNSSFAPCWSGKRGDGGLNEGGLVFREDLEAFAERPYGEILSDITEDRTPDILNLGGPAVIALVHVAQLLASQGVEVSYYGAAGEDQMGTILRKKLSSIAMKSSLKSVAERPTSVTDVFDDPSQRNGKGERSFVNTIGAAGDFGAADLPSSFYDCDIVLLGGTALVPALHDDLHLVLRRAKEAGCVTVVGTVYDFRNEKAAPDRRWPLGADSSYRDIDLLITDQEEALRLSGKQDIMQAAEELIAFGVGALIITRGALDIIVWSGGKLIAQKGLSSLPVSSYIDDLIAEDPSRRKDTTGCGDNFMGGVLVSLLMQLEEKRELIDMSELCAWGASSGGFTCLYHGGMYEERKEGEKRKKIEPAVQAYREILGEQV